MSNISSPYVFLRPERQGSQDQGLIPSIRYTYAMTRLSKAPGSKEAAFTDFSTRNHGQQRSPGLPVTHLCRLLPAACVPSATVPTITEQQKVPASLAPPGTVLDVHAADAIDSKHRLQKAVAFLLKWLLPILVAVALFNNTRTLDQRSRQMDPGAQYAPHLSYTSERPAKPAVEGKTVLRKAHPAVVSVEKFTAARSGESSHMRALGRNIGTGVVWDNKGHIVASYQAVKDAKQFKVTFSSGEKRLCRIIGLDELNDIAVLKVEGTDFKSMTPVDFDKSDMITGSKAVLNVENHMGRVMSVTSGVVMEECDSCEARWKPYRMSFSSPSTLRGVLMDSKMQLLGFHDGVGSGGIVGARDIDSFVNRIVQ